MKLTGVARRVAEQKHHRLAIGQPALGRRENRIIDAAGFIEDDETGARRIVLAAEGFRILRRARRRRAFPAFARPLAPERRGVDVEPVLRNAAFRPQPNRRPRFFLQLIVGVRGDRANRVAPRGHDPVRDHGGERAFADAAPTRNRDANRGDRMHAVKAVRPDLSPNLDQNLALPDVRPRVGFQFRPRQAPRVGRLHEAERIEREGHHHVSQIRLAFDNSRIWRHQSDLAIDRICRLRLLFF